MAKLEAVAFSPDPVAAGHGARRLESPLRRRLALPAHLALICTKVSPGVPFS